MQAKLSDISQKMEIFEIVKKTFSTEMHGLGLAIGSQILHLLKPNIFPILNEPGLKGYKELGLKFTNSIGTYVENAKAIHEFRKENDLETKNFRTIDVAFGEYFKYKESVKFFPNLILYGPPGTGKTYSAVTYAVAIIEGKSLSDIKKEKYDDILKRFAQYRDVDKLIAFTTFHQSYSYEEFIGGIRPNLTQKDISYELHSGVFKEFCDKAKKEFLTEHGVADNFDEAYQKLIEQLNDETSIEIQSRSGKKMQITLQSNGEALKHINTDVGLKAYYNKNQLYKVYKGEKSVTSGAFDNYRKAIIDYMKAKFSLKEYKKSEKNSTEINSTRNFVFIIDEINRGNISKIFGELITLVEDTKRLGAKEGSSAILPYFDEKFEIPINVHIIGTMNTADRSIALLDTALRRRFEFVEMLPQADLLENVTIDGINIKEMLITINERITALYDREHTIGHAYFWKLDKEENRTMDVLAKIMENKIIPLLQEYFHDDYHKIRLVLGDNQKKEEDLQFINMSKFNVQTLFGDINVEIDLENHYEINKKAFEKVEAYKYMGFFKKIADESKG